MKMTDNEIMNALKCCADTEKVECDECEYHIYRYRDCQEKAMKDVMELINRQKSEIDKLKKENTKMFEQWEILSDKTKEHYAELYDNALEVQISEAIKEFAERLKTDFLDLDVKTTHHNRKTVSLDEYIRQSEWLLHDVAIHEIDNLVKEMTEDK